MEKQMILTANTNSCKKVNDIVKKATDIMNTPMNMLRCYYSQVLERNVNMQQAKAITEAQAAFLATIMPADYNMALRMVALVWFIAAVKKCKKMLG